MNDTRLLRILKNLDALGCTLIANRAKAGEYISTYVWRVRKGWAIRFTERRYPQRSSGRAGSQDCQHANPQHNDRDHTRQERKHSANQADRAG